MLRRLLGIARLATQKNKGPFLYSPLKQYAFARPLHRTLATSTVSERIPATHRRSFGQPTAETHPYKIKQGQVTPGISASEYELRRSLLMKSLPMESVVVSVGYSTRYMTNNIFYPFHQSTDFWYLCGFNEPDAAMILKKDASTRGYKQIMFVSPKNPKVELWEGPCTGIDGVKELFGADEGYENSRFPSYLQSCFTAPHLFMDSPVLTPSLMSQSGSKMAIDVGLRKKAVKPLSKYVQELRLIKSDGEIELMKQSGYISSKAFIEAMKWTQPGYLEDQLWAKMEYECRMHGSSVLAYVPVVAGGPNALSLHYVRNDMVLKDGDLVLVDCGGEYNGYASDITRTWPVNGKFTEPQRQLYQAVLNVNKMCIKLCTEEADVSLHAIHAASVDAMKNELGAIGFEASRQDIETILYPHHVGHYLGLDVHDVHSIDRSRKLKSNTVITIEPGLYVPYNDKFPAQFQGIGIRIEDNVVIGRETPYVLTATAPKEIVDIEFCCANQKA